MNKINTDHNNRLIIYFFTTNLLFQMGGNLPHFIRLVWGKTAFPLSLKERGYPRNMILGLNSATLLRQLIVLKLCIPLIEGCHIRCNGIDIDSLRGESGYFLSLVNRNFTSPVNNVI